ncbi:MAG: type IX secretion system membrane protein PorP/SprF, partial [Chitinophagales bacterium]|nr:type IX secretion system membrane protein PorP/SprF [Chitinophagales bacterium]MDW8427019.1 type IX secretion system membrane protein PorP/SprF [Chitinophagales bacterium]
MAGSKLGLFSLALMAMHGTMAAQDLEFTQVYSMPVYENPAFAGSEIGPRFSLAHRNQWAGLNNAYLSFAAAYDQWAQALSGGIGLMAVADLQADGLYQRNSL